MNSGKMLFAQLMDHLPWTTFARIVKKYHGDKYVKHFRCTQQFRALAFAQITYREGLRDIEACMEVLGEKLYHLGFRQEVRRSTLSDANELRDWRIYAEFAQVLIKTARSLYALDKLDVELEEAVYALDSTTIDLCLSLFSWAPFRTTKGAIKLHTLLDLRGHIPSFIHISNGKMHDVNVLDLLVIEAGALYLMDRAYLDLSRLYTIQLAGAFFFTRAKSNTVLRRLYSSPVDRATGIMCDQVVVFKGNKSRKDYPAQLRKVKFKDPESGRTLVFLTNNFVLPAEKVCELYRQRWNVEVFFKWIKQHLRIKKFYGTSENAVKTQIWIAVSTYLLIAIVKKRLGLDHSMHTMLQILSLTQFEKIPMDQAFQKQTNTNEEADLRKQLILFDF
jgi:hypothetical protein